MARDASPRGSAASGARPVRSIPAYRGESRLDLEDLLAVLWSRKWSILVITLLVVGVALLVSSRQTPG